MGRAKLKMELIEKEKARHATFKKRKEGLVRKLHEFSILCDVNTCMIIYDPIRNTEPEVFPSDDPEQVRRFIELYRSKINNTTNTNSSVKTSGVADFFHDRKKQVEEELAKLRRKNLEAKYPTRPEYLDGLSVPELRQLEARLAVKAHRVKTLVNLLKGNPQAVSPITAAPPMPQSHHSASAAAAAANQQQQQARAEMVNDLHRRMQQRLQAMNNNNHPMMVRPFEGGSTSANIQLNHQVFLEPAGGFYAATLPQQFVLQPLQPPPPPPQHQFPSFLVPAVVQQQYFYNHDEEFIQYHMRNQTAAMIQNQEREQDDHEEFGVNNFFSY